jgi:hypothetical protein
MVALLVCEGDCNGIAVAEYDRAVALAGRFDIKESCNGSQPSTSALDDTWRSLARKFKHTPHRTHRMPDSTAICSICGTERQYGRSS